jgi:acyl-CoA thioester hydrolase
MVTFDFHTKIYYKDIDQMGVVYYARYLEYFEQARTELLNDIGLIVTEIEDAGFICRLWRRWRIINWALVLRMKS